MNANPCCRLANLSSLETYFIVRTNSNGERGSPCFNPLLPLKYSPCWPLMLITNFTEDMHFMTHCIQRGGNLRANRSSLINSQWTESKALCKSTFIIPLGEKCCLLCPLAKSWQSITLNNSSLPFTKAPYPLSIM